MSVGLPEFRAVIEALYEHPEWRQELRQLVLTEDLLRLPSIVETLSKTLQTVSETQRLLVEGQQRLEARVGRLEEEIAEDRRRTEERMRLLEEAMAALAEAQRQMEQHFEGRFERLEEAQRRTEARVEELAEAQRQMEQRFESRFERLEEAQRRTDEKVDRLAERVDRLEVRVDQLEEKVDNLGQAFGRLTDVIGSSLEDEAAGVAVAVLERKGYRILREPIPLTLDGEIDVIFLAEDPQGRQVWVVIEAKARLSQREVRAWARRMRSEGWRQRLVERGYIGEYLVYAYGIRIDEGARNAAEAEGIGLMKGSGEVIEPRARVEVR